jgi:hypothetical protein
MSESVRIPRIRLHDNSNSGALHCSLANVRVESEKSIGVCNKIKLRSARQLENRGRASEIAGWMLRG